MATSKSSKAASKSSKAASKSSKAASKSQSDAQLVDSKRKADAKADADLKRQADAKAKAAKADNKPAGKNKGETSLAENLNTDAQSNLGAPIVSADAGGKKKGGAKVSSTLHSSGKFLVTERGADGNVTAQYLSDEAK